MTVLKFFFLFFQLKSETVEKDELVAELQKECSSLKDLMAKAEADHKAALADQDKKFRQNHEELEMKNSEVKQSSLFCLMDPHRWYHSCFSNTGCHATVMPATAMPSHVLHVLWP